MKALLITFVLFVTVAIWADEVTYSDTFHNHYPVRGREFDMTRYDLETPSIVWGDGRQRKATILRTRGDKYPYEEQKCVITIEGTGLDTARVLSAVHFRTVDVSWITGKLLLLKFGIGHVAAVEAIYDVEKDLWVYRESVQYTRIVDQTVQRTGASRFAQRQIGRHRRLAPVADLCVQQYAFRHELSTSDILDACSGSRSSCWMLCVHPQAWHPAGRCCIDTGELRGSRNLPCILPVLAYQLTPHSEVIT